MLTTTKSQERGCRKGGVGVGESVWNMTAGASTLGTKGFFSLASGEIGRRPTQRAA